MKYINKKYILWIIFLDKSLLIARCADRAVLSSESAQILRLWTLTTPSICMNVFSTWEYSKPLGIPSIRTLTTSLIIATVVRITNTEKRNVHIGSTKLHVGWNVNKLVFYVIVFLKRKLQNCNLNWFIELHIYI